MANNPQGRRDGDRTPDLMAMIPGTAAETTADARKARASNENGPSDDLTEGPRPRPDAAIVRRLHARRCSRVPAAPMNTPTCRNNRDGSKQPDVHFFVAPIEIGTPECARLAKTRASRRRSEAPR